MSLDAFVTRISPEGKMLFSSYFGSSGLDGISDLKWRPDGVIVVVGSVGAADFPLKEPIQTTISPRTGLLSAFLMILADDGSSIRYSTFIGGTSSGGPTALVLDSKGTIYVVGIAADRGYPTKNPLFAEAEDYHGFLTIFHSCPKQHLLDIT